MSTIKVKVANPLNKQVKQVTVGKVDASSINMNDLGKCGYYHSVTSKWYYPYF